MGAVEIRTVKDHDLAGPYAGAQLPGPGVIMIARGVDDGEAWQEALQVEPQVALSRRLAAAMLGPVHAGGDQLNGRRVDYVDHPAEAVGEASPARAKARLDRLQMGQDLPKEPLGHGGVPDLVGVGKAIAARWCGAADPGKPALVVAKCIADVVEADGVGQLGVEHGHDVAPGAEGTGLKVDPVVAGQFSDKMARDEIAKLREDAELTPGWGCPSNGCFFHTAR